MHQNVFYLMSNLLLLFNLLLKKKLYKIVYMVRERIFYVLFYTPLPQPPEREREIKSTITIYTNCCIHCEFNNQIINFRLLPM